MVLLHGLGLGSWAMKRMEWAFERQGYRVINSSYRSRTTPIETLAEVWLPELLDRHDTDSARQLHFVTHSMGGIILRAFLADESRVPPNLGRVVMLAPPNAGSAVVDHLHDFWLFRLFTGINGRRLGTAPEALPNQLGPWTHRAGLGIIAGNRNLNPVFAAWHGEPNDGKVSLSSSRLPGMREHLVLPMSHTWLQYRARTIRHTLSFIKTGRF